MTSTSSVLSARCTSTLSMTTWKNSGETSANICRKNEATSTSLEQPAIFVDRAQEPADVEAAGESDNPARRVIRISSPSQTAISSSRVINAGAAPVGTDQDLVLGRPGQQHEAAIAQRCDGRQRRPGKPRPVGPNGACLQPEVLGAPEHFRCANLVGSQPMPDLLAIGRDALETQ